VAVTRVATTMPKNMVSKYVIWDLIMPIGGSF
jgi:hypothetical protein